MDIYLGDTVLTETQKLELKKIIAQAYNNGLKKAISIADENNYASGNSDDYDAGYFNACNDFKSDIQALIKE